MGYVNPVNSAGLNAIVPAISVECVRGLTDLGEVTLGEGPLPVGLFLPVEEMMTRKGAIILIFNKIEVPTEDSVDVVGDVGVDVL